MSSEIIEFKGIVYRRYPHSKNWADKSYFTPGHADRKQGFGRLHEEIWINTNGPIPEGHHIHHVDFDPLNNDIRNLQCLTAGDHARVHAAAPKRIAYLTSPEQLEHLAQIRPLTLDWHASEEGRKWHSEHGKRTWERPPTTAACEHCAKQFQSKLPGRFCSNACKSSNRRASRVDFVERICLICQKQFTADKYKKTKTCSRSCGNKLKN